MIDAHTHLNAPDLFLERQKHINDFEKIGGTKLVNVWADHEYNRNWLIISKTNHSNCLVNCTIGFHPYEIVIGNINENNIKKEIDTLKSMYLANKEYIIAIWEIGIDSHYNWDTNLVLQKQLFKMQCELAKELNLPVIIHSRDDFDSTMEVLENFRELKIYFHCRWYGPEEVKNLQNYKLKDYWIWFSGNVSYPKANNIRESLMICDIEKILIETDAPYLSPQKIRSKINAPVNIKYIYDFVSNTLKIDLHILKNQIEKNFDKLYYNR